MLPESVKAKAQAEIDKLEKQLHADSVLKKSESYHEEGKDVYGDSFYQWHNISFEGDEDIFAYSTPKGTVIYGEDSEGEKDFSTSFTTEPYYLEEAPEEDYSFSTLQESKAKAFELLRTKKLDKASKELHESKETKAEEKAEENKMTGESEGERNVGMDEEKDYIEAKTKALEKSLKDKTISETQRKRDEKELALFKGTEAKKPTTIKFGNITFTIDSAELENGGNVYGGHIDIYNRVIKGFPYNYKTAKEVEERMKSYIKEIKSVTYNGSKGRESQKLPYLVIFNDGQAEIKEKFETAKEALNFQKVLDSIVNSNNASKPTTTSKKEVVGYAIVDPISGEIVVSKKTIRQLIEASEKLEKTKGFEDMGDLAYEIIKKDDKNVLGDKIKSVDIKSLPIGKKPTTRKAPVKKAVVKKKVEGLKPKFKVGDVVLVNYGEEKGVVGAIETVAYYEKYPQSMKPTDIPYYEIKGASKDISENNLELYKATKPDHKKLLAKIKAKKGDKEYDNKASLNPETGERRKRSESSDKKREALPLGKRVSADGNVYWENRLNRGDLSKKDKFEKGGEVKGSDWGLNLNW